MLEGFRNMVLCVASSTAAHADSEKTQGIYLN